jgi:hypothetical protein
LGKRLVDFFDEFRFKNFFFFSILCNDPTEPMNLMEKELFHSQKTGVSSHETEQSKETANSTQKRGKAKRQNNISTPLITPMASQSSSADQQQTHPQLPERISTRTLIKMRENLNHLLEITPIKDADETQPNKIVMDVSIDLDNDLSQVLESNNTQKKQPSQPEPKTRAQKNKRARDSEAEEAEEEIEITKKPPQKGQSFQTLQSPKKKSRNLPEGEIAASVSSNQLPVQQQQQPQATVRPATILDVNPFLQKYINNYRNSKQASFSSSSASSLLPVSGVPARSSLGGSSALNLSSSVSPGLLHSDDKLRREREERKRCYEQYHHIFDRMKGKSAPRSSKKSETTTSALPVSPPMATPAPAPAPVSVHHAVRQIISNNSATRPSSGGPLSAPHSGSGLKINQNTGIPARVPTTIANNNSSNSNGNNLQKIIDQTLHLLLMNKKRKFEG